MTEVAGLIVCRAVEFNVILKEVIGAGSSGTGL